MDEYVERHPGQRLSTCLSKFFPDLPVLDAVSELREQLHAAKTQAKHPYPGRRSGIRAINYLLENYGEEISGGRLVTLPPPFNPG